MSMQQDDVGQKNNERWIPILDYAVLRGISTSTLRRYIKANKIQFKIENGKYLLLADSIDSIMAARHSLEITKEKVQITQNTLGLFQKVKELEESLLRAEEEISELKMLVAIYEEKLSPKDH